NAAPGRGARGAVEAQAAAPVEEQAAAPVAAQAAAPVAEADADAKGLSAAAAHSPGLPARAAGGAVEGCAAEQRVASI
ncbi:MAG: hypothetical protein ACK5PF_05900, partial [bacterium]